MRWTVSQGKARNLIQQAPGNVVKEARTKEKVGQRVEVFNNPSSQARVEKQEARQWKFSLGTQECNRACLSLTLDVRYCCSELKDGQRTEILM